MFGFPRMAEGATPVGEQHPSQPSYRPYPLNHGPAKEWGNFTEEWITPYRTNLGAMRKQVDDLAREWAASKVRAQLDGFEFDSWDSELQRMEFGRVIYADQDMNYMNYFMGGRGA